MPLELFPGVLGEIAEVAGEEAARKLSAAYGGTRKHIPASVSSDDHWLVQCVGRDAAESICNWFSVGQPEGNYRCGEEVLIPRGAAAIIERRREIINLSCDGLGAGAIARQLGVSERMVYRVRASVRGRTQIKTRRLALPPRDKR